LQWAADQGLIECQLHFATLLRQGRVIQADRALSAQYLKLAAGQDSIQAQFEYAVCLLHGDGVPVQLAESEYYFRKAVQQGDRNAEMRRGICLLSGQFGLFDFDESRELFNRASQFNRFAVILRDSLSQSDCELTSSLEFSFRLFIFSFLRSSSDDSMAMIRLLNPHLSDQFVDESQSFGVWEEFVRDSFEYLIDLSKIESYILGSSPSELLSCESISAMISLIFRMYTVQSSLFENVNHFLRRFPIEILGKFMSELGGIVRYIYLLQSSIECYSQSHPLESDVIVYRGISSKGKQFAPLYELMIDEVIVWSGFTSKLVLICQVHHSILLNGKMSGQRAGLKRLNAPFSAGSKLCSQ
jgi:hypothetical protein